MRFGALTAAEAKYARALEDFQALDRDVRRFLNSKPYRMGVEFEPQSGWHVARLRIREEPPPRLSVIAGNVAYQLLSGLNHVAWELAVRKLGIARARKKRQGIEFPIAKTSGDFDARAIVTQRLVSKQALAVFDKLQPYNRTNGEKTAPQHPLVTMKEVADADKHRILAPSFGRGDFGSVQFRWNQRIARGPRINDTLRRRSKLRAIPDGAELARIRFETGNDQVHVRVKRQPAIGISFESDNWTLGMEGIASWVFVAHHAFVALSGLFPRESASFPMPRFIFGYSPPPHR